MFKKIQEYKNRIEKLEKEVADLKKKVSIKDPNEKSNDYFGLSWTFFGNFASKQATIGETVSLLLSHLGLEVKHNDEQFALQSVKRANKASTRRGGTVAKKRTGK